MANGNRFNTRLSELDRIINTPLQGPRLGGASLSEDLGRDIDEALARRKTGSRKEPGRLGSAVSSFARGAASVVSAVPKSIDEAAAALGRRTGIGFTEPEEGALFKFGQAIDEQAEEIFQTNPEFQEEFSQKVAGGLGSAAGFIGGGIAGRLAKIPAWLTTSLLGGAASSQEAVDDFKNTLEEQGKVGTPEQREAVAGLGAIVGLSEAIPIMKALDRFDKASGGALKNNYKRILKEGAKGAGEEAMQEAFQQTAQNFIARDLVAFDPERGLFRDTPESAAVGGSVGFIMNVIASGLGGRRGGKIEQATNKALGEEETPLTIEPSETINPLTKQEFVDKSVEKSFEKLTQLNQVVNEGTSVQEDVSVPEQQMDDIISELEEQIKPEEGKTVDPVKKAEIENVINHFRGLDAEQIQVEREETVKPERKTLRPLSKVREREIARIEENLDEEQRKALRDTLEGIQVEEVDTTPPTTERIEVEEIPEQVIDQPIPTEEITVEEVRPTTPIENQQEDIPATKTVEQSPELTIAAGEQLIPESTEAEQIVSQIAQEPSPQLTQEQPQEAIQVPEGAIVKKDGTPFKTQMAAKGAIKRQKLSDTHTSVQVGDNQWAVVPNQTIQEQRPTKTVEGTEGTTQVPIQATPVTEPVSLSNEEVLQQAFSRSPEAQATGETFNEWLEGIGGRESADTRALISQNQSKVETVEKTTNRTPSASEPQVTPSKASSIKKVDQEELDKWSAAYTFLDPKYEGNISPAMLGTMRRFIDSQGYNTYEEFARDYEALYGTPESTTPVTDSPAQPKQPKSTVFVQDKDKLVPDSSTPDLPPDIAKKAQALDDKIADLEQRIAKGETARSLSLQLNAARRSRGKLLVDKKTQRTIAKEAELAITTERKDPTNLDYEDFQASTGVSEAVVAKAPPLERYTGRTHLNNVRKKFDKFSSNLKNTEPKNFSFNQERTKRPIPFRINGQLEPFIHQDDTSGTPGLKLHYFDRYDQVTDPILQEQIKEHTDNGKYVNAFILNYVDPQGFKHAFFFGTQTLNMEELLLHEVTVHYGLRNMFEMAEKNGYEKFLLRSAQVNPTIIQDAINLIGLTYVQNAEQFGLTAPASLNTASNPLRLLATPQDNIANTTLIDGTRYVTRNITTLLDEYIAARSADFTTNPQLKDEYFARLNSNEKGFWKRLLNVVRHFFRTMIGPKASNLSNDELYSLIGESYQYHSRTGKGYIDIVNKMTQRGVSPQQVVNYSQGMLANFSIENQAEANTARDMGQTQESIDDTVSLMNQEFGAENQSAWQRRINHFIDDFRKTKFLKLFNDRGGLPFDKVYNREVSLGLGGLETSQKLSREVSKIIKPMTELQRQSVMEYMRDPEGSVDNLPLTAVQKRVIERSKQEIINLGQRLVDLGLLSQEVFDRNKGSYLPTRYWKYIDQFGGSGKRLSLMQFLRKQKDIPEGERAVLGKIEDPELLIPETVATIGRDVSLYEMMQSMIKTDATKNLGWILGAENNVVYKNNKWTIDQIEDEVERLGTQLEDGIGGQIHNYSPAQFAGVQQEFQDARQALQIGEQQLQDKFVEVMQAQGIEEPYDQAAIDNFKQANYKRLPKNKQFGPLSGKWVRKEIFDDFFDTHDMFTQEATDALSKTLNQAQKAHRIWKTLKVPLNPPSWVRNGIGNFTLLDISTNTNATSLFKMLQEEFKSAVVDGSPSKYWNLAHSRGLFGTTFSANELFLRHEQYKDKMKAALATKDGANPIKSMFWMFNEKFAKLMELSSEVYGGLEGWFKTVRMRDHIQRWEKENNTSIDNLPEGQKDAVITEAVHQANKAIFDYSAVPQWLRVARRQPFIGAPFLTFTYKSLPAVIESFARRPQKFIKYAALPYALQQAMIMSNGMDDDDVDKINRSMPLWMREKSSIYILPWKDENKKWQAVDFGYFLPWAPFHNMMLHADQNFDPRSPVTSTFKELLNVGTSLGMLGGPIPTLSSALLTNQDTFTGRQIIDPGSNSGDKFADGATFFYSTWMPSFLTSSGILGRALDQYGIQMRPFSQGRELTAFGTDRETGFQTALRGIGINAYGFDPKESMSNNIKAFRAKEQEIKKSRSKVMKNPNLSRDAKVKQLKEFNTRLKILRQKKRTTLLGEG